MKILINGGCGFLGSNLAAYGLEMGNEVTVFDNLSRVGGYANFEWLKSMGGAFHFIHGDVRNKNDVENTIKTGEFDVIFHLAGQVAMTTSIVDPYKDFQINVIGTLNVLETIRKYSPHTAVFFSSTNKVYGDLENYTYKENATRYVCEEFPNGFDESVPLDFRTPYGCSKGAADQYMLDYAKTFGIKATVFRHSSMYGSHQYATYDQGWVGWFVKKAIEKKKNPNCEKFTISGNGKQVRDLLQARDMMTLYYAAVANIDTVCGEAYNVGGTIQQSMSLLELFDLLEQMLDVKLEYEKLPPRQSDQKVFVADITKINKRIGWEPKVKATDGVAEMIEWEWNNNKNVHL